VGAGDRAPTVLSGLHQLEHHRQGRGRTAGPAGDLGPQLDRGERGLDGVRGPQVDPVLGREVVDRQQLLGVVGDLRDGLGPLGAVGLRERLDRLLRVRAVLGVADLLQRLGCARLCGLRQGVRDISGLVDPEALVAAGNTSASPFHRPIAPSPTTSSGGARMPRRRQSRSMSAHDSVDSRRPSASAISSLVPSTRTPSSTSTQEWAWPSLTLGCTPSAHT
jgi:hypothetical protein